MPEGGHPFIPVPGVVNVQIVYTIFGQRVQNVFNVLSGGGLTLADLDRIEAKFETWLRTWWTTGSTEAVGVALLSLVDVSVEGGIGKEYFPSPPIIGGIATSTLPTNVTFAVKWTTGLTGRSNRGRTFHVGVSPASVSGDQLMTASAPAFANVYNQLRIGLQAGGVVDRLVVVSKSHNKAWRTTAAVNVILGCSVDANLDSMRSRLAGRGT